MQHTPPRPLWSLWVLTLLPLMAAAQGVRAPAGGAARPFAYQIGEQSFPDGGRDAQTTTTADDPASQGPVRLARFSYVHGSITWRAAQDADWSQADVNLPLRQGAQVWVTGGGRAEVQFDDGSLLRLGGGALVTLQTLYSDADGEYTEIQMNRGLASLELRHATSIFQVNTPFVSVKSAGPAKVRVGVDDDVEVAVRDGSAAVEGTGRKTVLRSGDYLDVSDAEAAYQVAALPGADSWDRWNDDRDLQLADTDSDRYLPPNIALVSGNLDDSGSWRDDPQYGHVWCPRVDDADWRPYQHGHWVWVQPFGWTWVSSESWGWAPYHYGTWVDQPYGWAWVPGPARQFWCPAVVHFSEYNGDVAWCPLAPAEVRYPPALSAGFRSGGWSLDFSIGGCAVFYPAGERFCEPRPFSNVIVNRTVYVNNVTNVYNINRTTVNRNVSMRDYHFVPQNAQTAGVTTASAAEFGGRGAYRPAPRIATAYFSQGRSVGAPARGDAPVAGPIGVRPTAEAYTPSRRFLPSTQPDAASTQRPLFRAPLPRRVAQAAPPLATPSPRTFRTTDTRGGFGSGPARLDQPQQTRPFRRSPSATDGLTAPALPGGQPARPFSDPERRRRAALDARQSLGQPMTGDAGRVGPSRPQAYDNVPGDNVPRDTPRPRRAPDFPGGTAAPAGNPRPFRGTSVGQDGGQAARRPRLYEDRAAPDQPRAVRQRQDARPAGESRSDRSSRTDTGGTGAGGRNGDDSSNGRRDRTPARG